MPSGSGRCGSDAVFGMTVSRGKRPNSRLGTGLLVGVGLLTVGTGFYLMVLRPPLLPEDIWFAGLKPVGRAAQPARVAGDRVPDLGRVRPGLRGRHRRVPGIPRNRAPCLASVWCRADSRRLFRRVPCEQLDAPV